MERRYKLEFYGTAEVPTISPPPEEEVPITPPEQPPEQPPELPPEQPPEEAVPTEEAKIPWLIILASISLGYILGVIAKGKGTAEGR